jgi:hypothetical protein
MQGYTPEEYDSSHELISHMMPNLDAEEDDPTSVSPPAGGSRHVSARVYSGGDKPTVDEILKMFADKLRGGFRPEMFTTSSGDNGKSMFVTPTHREEEEVPKTEYVPLSIDDQILTVDISDNLRRIFGSTKGDHSSVGGMHLDATLDFNEVGIKMFMSGLKRVYDIAFDIPPSKVKEGQSILNRLLGYPHNFLVLLNKITKECDLSHPMITGEAPTNGTKEECLTYIQSIESM